MNNTTIEWRIKKERKKKNYSVRRKYVCIVDGIAWKLRIEFSQMIVLSDGEQIEDK